MTLQSAPGVVALGTSDSPHYVDWGAILAGAVVASAISILLFTFGTAVGLSMVSPWEGEGASTTAYFVTLGLWTLWVVVSSFLAGGYIAGRLRRRIGDGNEHEVEVRDSVHGIVVWAVGLVIAAILLAAGITGAAGVAVKTTGLAAGAAAGTGVNEYTVDSLMRPTSTPTPMPADGTVAPTDATRQSDRAEMGRLLAFGTKGGVLTPDNKKYLASRIAARTGMTPAEAEARVDQVLTDAKIAADKARKTGLIIGFLTAAALAVAAAAAAWASHLGGRHRDQGTDVSAFWRWR